MTDRPTPTAQLTELREIRDAMVAKRMDDWWPEMVEFGHHADGFVSWCRYSTVDMDPADALALVVAAGERVLEAKGWYLSSCEDQRGWLPRGTRSVFVKTLPDALRAVMENAE
jgi:hypothetical protein